MKNSDSKNTNDPLYFFGNSEAGKAAREVNWSQHPLGTPQGWPVSLKTTLGILFNARQAMFLFWGELKFGFYNDAQIPILGHARHPHVMGKTGLEIWPEVWEQFALPQINIAMMGESTWSENQLIPILRSSQTDDGYFSYGYSPVYTEDGSVGGAIVTCIETTGKVLAERNLKENEQRLNITLASVSEAEQKVVDVLECMNDGFIALDKDFKVLRVNRNQERIFGLDRSQTVGKNHWDIWPKESFPKTWEAYHKVINERVPVRIENFNSALNIWITVDAFPTPDNGIAAFFTDITVRKTAQIDYERSVDVSPAILWITDKDGSCNYLSKQWYEFTGQTPEQALGFGWLGATHPEDKAQAGKLFTEANKAQKPFYAEYRIKTKEGGYRWTIDAGNPRYDANKNYLGYAGTVLDIHDLAVERQKLEAAERQLKFESHKLEMIFKESPAAMVLWRGHDLVFEKVNPQYQAIFPDRQLADKPFLEACPEFVGMPFIGYLRNVFKTGESYVGIEEYAPLKPMKDGPLEDRYYDFSYHRIDDTEGKPYGVYTHAIDVTERVSGRKMAEAREESLRLALKGGKLGAWSLHFPEGIFTIDERTRELHGILPDDNLSDIVSRQAHPDDHQKITDALDAVIKGASVYDLEYRVNDLNGKCRWIHALGEAKRDKHGNLKTLTGVAADHTLQIDMAEAAREGGLKF